MGFLLLWEPERSTSRIRHVSAHVNFTYTGTNSQAGGATQTHVAQLLGALGTRAALQPGISGDGVTISATGSARLLPSTFINNRIERNNGTVY